MSVTFGVDDLASIGLGALAPDDAQLVVEVALERLRDRVGVRTMARMTRAELSAFERAVEAGTEAPLVALARAVPDYDEIATAELELLRAEMLAAAPTLLQTSGADPRADHDPWRHRRPDVGPALVGDPAGWCSIVSPQARVIVTVDPTRCELYARRDRLPPVVLAVPDAHRIEPTTVWCDDTGEVRAEFAPRSDLRWVLAGVPTSAVVEYDKALRRVRPALRWAAEPSPSGGFRAIDHGRWHVEDGPIVSVEDRLNGGSLTLDALHDGRHWNAVEPHFTPDGGHLVAAFNTDQPVSACAVFACSVGYLDAARQSHAPDGYRWPWEHQIWPNDPRRLTGEIDPHEPARDATYIGAVGYDASATRLGVRDRRRTHLIHARRWSHLGTMEHPDARARTVRIGLPLEGSAPLAWAGQSIVVCGEGRSVWRLDLRRVSAPERLPAAERPSAVAAALRLGSRAMLVYADRTMLAVDADGEITETSLSGTTPVRTACLLRDGRMLLAVDGGLELWSGSSRSAQVELAASPIVRLAPCASSKSWALAVHADHSVSTIRLSRQVIHIEPDSIPSLPGEGFELRASDAVLPDLNSWLLLGPAGGGLNDGKPYVAGPRTFMDADARSATFLEPADLVVFGSTTGLLFDTPGLMPRNGLPLPVDLDGEINNIATTTCARSIACTSEGALHLVRLLT